MQDMKRTWRRWLAAYALTVAGGFLFHFLYDLSPNVVFAVLSPVRESVWEHLKILFWPMLLVGWGMTRQQVEQKPSWYFATLLGGGLLLMFGWVVHIRIGMEQILVDVVGMMVVELIAFLAAAWMEIGERWKGLLLLGLLAVIVLIVAFTFWQPEGLLFADLSRADALYTLPC